jgi:hypothetical protein
MNTSTSLTIKRPCAAWANFLAAAPEDLTAAERAALDAHVATCEACAAARADYARMDALIRSLPAPAPLVSLPAYPRERWRVDDTQDTTTKEPVAPPTDVIPVMAARRRSQVSPQWAAFRAIAAVLVVGVVIAGFAALLGHRQPGGSTGFNGDFGPTVLPTGSQPQISAWRALTLPPEMPNLAALYDATKGDTGFTLTAQTSVTGLLYACWSPPMSDGSALLWRSEDFGLHWKRLATPTTAPTRCYLEVSPGAPNTVFLATTSSTPGYYSLDRGDHWSRHTPPAGYEQWNAGAPTAEGDVWYYRSRDADEQPVFLVTSDRGAHWETHGFPFHVNISPLPGPSPLFGPYLRVRYEKGGYIVPYEDTLWWTPDYGATWRKLGAWGDGSMGYTPPCDGLIRGTPDLSLFYCVAWNGQFEYRPYWRSVDRGLTWRAVPYGPPVAPTKDTPLAGIGAIPMLLRDGSLLQLSPTPGDPSKVAFYSLARGTNVWRQASKPLNDVVRLCSSQQGAGPAPTCVIPPTIVITDGANGGQNIYLTQADGTTVMAAIAWR